MAIRIFFIFSLFCSFNVAATPPASFAKSYDYQEAKISPDGTKLGVVLLNEGTRQFVVFGLPGFNVLGGSNLGKRAEFGTFYWVNNERIVAQVLQRKAWKEEPENYGELFAVNYDGSKPELIYGYRAHEKKTGSHLKRKEATRGWAKILNMLPGDENNILISSTKMSENGGSLATVHKLNVYSGRLSRAITRSPIPFAEFTTTKDGELAFAVGRNEDYEQKAYRYEDDDWIEISQDVGDDFTPLALDPQGKKLFFLDDFNQDKQGLFTLNINSGERTTVYTDNVVDITSVSFNSDRTSVYALRVDDGYPTYVMFNNSGEEAALFKSFLATFEGSQVSITSRSKDGKMWILYVASDIDAGSFYLYNSEGKSLSMLFSNMSHIDVNTMAKAMPVSFASFDDTQIHGYITYPNGMSENQQVPMVTLVHGGPHGPRDYWYFDREAQMLAAQGYAVLRINYRGSGGYGEEYMHSGYLEWGNAIQKDIIAGTKWAISQGKIDKDNICIMGASFGGYSAVMSATLNPDLFKCVVANAGVYDLEMMHDEGDIPEILWGESYLNKAIGSDREQLREFSPVNHVEKLTAPILIAHGEKDRRVPFEHAEALREALEKHNKSFDWFIKRTESHGFFDEKNRAEYYNTVADFLSKYIK